jgi:hypothetical protein
MFTAREMQAGTPPVSVLSLALRKMHNTGLHLALFAGDTTFCMRLIARRILSSENSVAVSAKWRCCVSGGALK